MPCEHVLETWRYHKQHSNPITTHEFAVGITVDTYRGASNSTGRALCMTYNNWRYSKWDQTCILCIRMHLKPELHVSTRDGVPGFRHASLVLHDCTIMQHVPAKQEVTKHNCMMSIYRIYVTVDACVKIGYVFRRDTTSRRDTRKQSSKAMARTKYLIETKSLHDNSLSWLDVSSARLETLAVRRS